MKRKEPLAIGNIIDRVFESIGATEEYQGHQAESQWPEVAGKNIAAATIGVRFVEGVLHVTLTSASLKEQLGYLRPTLIDKLNALLPRPIVRDVRIH